jgi:hypothetical protein
MMDIIFLHQLALNMSYSWKCCIRTVNSSSLGRAALFWGSHPTMQVFGRDPSAFLLFLVLAKLLQEPFAMWLAQKLPYLINADMKTIGYFFNRLASLGGVFDDIGVIIIKVTGVHGEYFLANVPGQPRPRLARGVRKHDT